MIRTPHAYVLLLASAACSAQAIDPPGPTPGIAGAAGADALAGAGGATSFAGGTAGGATGAGGTVTTSGGFGGNAGESGSNAGSASGGTAGVNSTAGGSGGTAGVNSTAGGTAGVNSAGGSGGAQADLAVNHCYKSGCTGQWKNDPCNAFDGDLTTATGPAKSWDSSLGTVAVDFGAMQPITTVVVSFEDNTDPNPGYALEGSNDGQSWTLIKNVTSPSLVDTQSNLNVSFRYLRVHSKQFFFDPWWMHSIREVEVRQ